MSSLWSSARLVYRAFEKEDVPFLLTMQIDPQSWLNTAPHLAIPPGKSSATSSLEWHTEKCMLGVIICLPAPIPPQRSPVPGPDGGATGKPIPIGTVCLSAGDPRQVHHRNSTLGISIVRIYQGQGYGSESIRWALQWGFRFANLHRIDLAAFSWNPGAIRLYEKLGFVREGCKREHFWYDGKYWDAIELGMLESEWRERYGGEKDVVVGVSRMEP